MDTGWQPVTWQIFHIVSLNYNDSNKEEYKKFFRSFRTIIPCSICRGHYNSNLDKSEMNIENNVNQENIFNWTVLLHNKVNKMHSKKIWSNEEAKNFYSGNRFNIYALFKYFILAYIRSNFRKGPEKTQQLFNMLHSFAYLHPNEDKRKQLIDFTTKFQISRENIKSWLYSFLMLLKN